MENTLSVKSENRAFIKDYVKKLILISLPIALSQVFLNLASLLDTLMVGQLDDANVSGVYIATQIIFVMNLMLFGSVEGASVFFSQFYGIKDNEHMRKCFNFKIGFSVIVAVVESLILYIFGKNLISLFTKDSAEIEIAWKYLMIVGASLIPYAITCSLSTTIREMHHTVSVMVITIIGVVLNFVFNYIFIFGKFSLPRLEGAGAAVGTLVNRLVEMILLISFVLIKKFDFIKGFLRNFKMEKSLFKDMFKKSIPLFFNETLWSLSQTVLVFFFTQADSIATSSLPIVQTIFNLLFIVMIGIGNGETILVGNTIGEGKNEEAQKQAYISLIFTFITCVVLGTILFALSNPVVSLYKGVSLDARSIASILLKFMSFNIVINGMNTSMFFLLRAGGRTGVVFFFDSFYGWIISIPLSCLLTYVFRMELIPLYITVYTVDIIKSIIGFILIFNRKWYKNLTVVKE